MESSAAANNEKTGYRLFLGTQDGVFRRFGHAELDHALGGDLDLFTGRRIAAHAGLAVDQHQFSEARNGEAVLGVFVGQVHECLKGGCGLLFGDLRRLSNRGDNL